MSKTLLIKNIKAIITCDKNDNLFTNQNIFIKDGVIDYIGKEILLADEVIDGKDMYVYPGLVNSHHHLFQTFTRNLPQVQNMELFDWLTTLYEIWKGVVQESVKYSSLIGMGELMKYGCTTCFDHHYLFPKDAEDTLIDEQFNSARTLGIRYNASRGSMTLSKKDGGLPPDSVVQSTDKVLYDSERLIKKYHNKDRYSMTQVVLAPCAPFNVTKEVMIESAIMARQYDVRLHTHLAETRDEEEYTMRNFKMRPLEYMDTLGWIGNDVWYAHGIHFNDDELKVLAKTQTGVAHCPISNMKLASGVARIPEMIKMGIPVGLAVDGSASNDASNLLEEIRVGYLLHRSNYSNNAPTGYDILKLATNGSAKLLGRDDIGSLEVGKAADLFMIRTNKFELVGGLEDPKSLLGTLGIKRPVDYTIVNGEIVVKDGKLVKVDEDKLFYEANEAVKVLLSKV